MLKVIVELVEANFILFATKCRLVRGAAVSATAEFLFRTAWIACATFILPVKSVFKTV